MLVSCMLTAEIVQRPEQLTVAVLEMMVGSA
jgi:hypothetical protein